MMSQVVLQKEKLRRIELLRDEKDYEGLTVSGGNIREASALTKQIIRSCWLESA